MFDKTILEEVRKLKEGYDASVEKSLGKQPERRESFTTGGGIPLKRLYTPVDIDGVDYEKDLGLPGSFPLHQGSSGDPVQRSFLDHASICRFCHCRGLQSSLSHVARSGNHGPFRRL